MERTQTPDPAVPSHSRSLPRLAPVESVEIPLDGGPSSSSVHPDETTSQPRDSLYESFRHSSFRKQRTAVEEALRVVHPPTPLTEQIGETRETPLDRFRRCGSRAWLLKSKEDTPRYRLGMDRCRHRYCPACARERGLLIAANIRTKLPRVQLRFLTLTIKTDNLSLPDALAKLSKSWQSLRRRKCWTNYVQGGLAVLEIGWRPTSNRWHPHLHVLWQGEYFPHSELRASWLASTGDSWVCDVRKVHDLDHAAKYLTKYLTKSLAKEVWSDPDRLLEAITATRHRKLISTFGTWSKLRLLDPLDDDTEWVTVCPVADLLRAISRGDKRAVEIGLSLWKRSLVDWLKEHPP